MSEKDRPDMLEVKDLPDGTAPSAGGPKQRRGLRARQRILRSTAVLPSLFTLSNGLAGFGAIHFATKDAADFEERMANLAIAAWLLFVAMVCDMLDGRVARMTRRTSDFGGQLDSLCDVISFGVAPAIMMLRAVVGAMRQMSVEPRLAIERTVWCVAGVYVACAALRLARFNVENEPDESAHMDFRGLPSPGAAAAIAGTLLLFEHLINIKGWGWLSSSWLAEFPQRFVQPWAMGVLSFGLTGLTLAVALLMVSRFRYVHLVNQYVHGKRPFSYLVKLVVVVLLALVEPFVALALATVGYAASGPIGAVVRKLRLRSHGADQVE